MLDWPRGTNPFGNIRLRARQSCLERAKYGDEEEEEMTPKKTGKANLSVAIGSNMADEDVTRHALEVHR